MISTAILAANFRAIGLTVGALTFVGFVLMLVRNIRAAKPELGSEIELAPNRKPYLSDEELEGPKLDRALTFALGMLGLLAVGLPLYWLAEPGRQEGAVAAYNLSFEVRGANTYTVDAQCVNCHAAGGVGGGAAYVLQDADGQFLANVTWKAPALNNVLLRYSEDEVRYILNYGRPGSPMAAWGTPGGGPLTEQAVNNVIIYLRTLQQPSLDPVEIQNAGDPNTADDPESLAAQEAADTQEAAIRAEVDRSIQAGEFDTVGEAVFNLGLFSGFEGGSLSCGRCHTSGWSVGLDNVLDEGIEGCGGGDPSGIGFNLCGGQTKTRFPDDTWKDAQGNWIPLGGLTDDDGSYIEASNGDKIRLDDTGSPVTADGERYLVLDEGVSAPGIPDAGGDLASCDFVSKLWQPAAGNAYPFDPEITPTVDEAGTFVDPPELEPSDVPGQVITLGDGRLASQCDVIEMPERTSQAHYDFVYTGAVAGKGYGRGGQSAAGLMPGFGGSLPPDYIQAVVDYERGL
ncbi:MAG: c-type cytochrome [Acidimicrobiales bacterium]